MTYVSTPITRSAILIVSLALAACGGSSSGNNNRQPPPDTVSPNVSAVTVPAGSTLNRTVTLTATASDAGGVAEVRFLLDGALLGSDTTSPYSFDWDTSSLADGDYVLRAEAEDTAGNIAQSSEVTVTIANLVQFLLTASGDEEVPPVETAGSAQADLSVDLVTGAVSGTVSVSGFTPTASHIHDGFAGTTGGVVIGLDQGAQDE